MNNYEKTITEKWNLPLEESIKVEALSHNLNSFIQKDDIIKELYKYLKNKELVQKVLSYSPFIDYQDTRYQIYVTYAVKAPRYLIERKITGDDSIDDEVIFTSMQGYYNYYPKEDLALKKYQEKLLQLKEYPEIYCYLEGSCTVLMIEIKLVDAVRNCIIERNFMKGSKL